MKTIHKLLLILMLTIIHVHFSVNTQDNLLNPLSFLIMCSSRTEWIGERNAYFLGGLLLHSIVTISISWYLFKWNKVKIWAVDVAICILIGLYMRYGMGVNLNPIWEIDSFYEKLYKTKRLGICNDVITFSFVQFLLLISYSVTSLLTRKISNYRKRKKQRTFSSMKQNQSRNLVDNINESC